MGLLSIQFLGGFQIQYDGKPVEGFDSFKTQSLLAYLLLHRLNPVARRQAAFLLWLDSTEEQALANLRHLLFVLRRSLPNMEQYVEVGTRTIQWRAGAAYQFDVQDFEQAVGHTNSIADLQKAVQLYTGELLPGHFDEWVLEERERLRGLNIQTLERLVELYEQKRDFSSAIHYAQRLLEADLHNEASYRRLMTLHALNHDRAAAVNVYHRCAATLMRELEVTPDKDTQELYELLLSAETLPEPPSIASAYPLVGRQEEWRQLQSTWSSAMHRHAQLVLLLGEAGLGKTRLAEELVQQVARQGISNASAHCYAAEGSLAFAPLTEWLRSLPLQFAKDSWLVEVSRLLPEIAGQHPHLPPPRPLQESWQRQVFFEALADVIASSNRPLLLWVDDLHWCDRDTLEWLHFFLRYKSNERVLILGTARDDEVDHNQALAALVSALHSSGQLTRIQLAPLDAANTSVLGAHVTDRAIGKEQALALYKESEGNPLFIIELLLAQVEILAPAHQEKESRLSPDIKLLPARIQQVINDRLRKVSPEARDLLGLTSVLGNSVQYSLIQSASDLAEGVLVQLLDELWRKGILREQGTDTYAFSHEKIREVMYAGLSPVRRRWLHRRTAEALESMHAGALEAVGSQLAAHYEQAALLQPACMYYLQAAKHAVRLFSNAEAIVFLEKGLNLLNAQPEARERDQLELSYQLELGAVHLSRQIRAPEVRQAYARANTLASQVGDQSERFDALKGLWEIDNYWLNLDLARQLGEAMLLLAEQADQVEQKISAHYALGTTTFLCGDYEASKFHLEEGSLLYNARQPALEHFHGVHPGVGCQSRLAWTLCFLGYVTQAFQTASKAVELAQQLGHPYSQCFALTLETFLNLMFRQKQVAAARAREAIALAEQYDYRFWVSSATRMLGWATIQPDQGKDWAALLHNEDQMWHTVHTFKPAIWFTLSQSLYVEGLAISGQVEQGLKRLEEILQKLKQSPEKIWEPELYRLKGELLRRRGDSQEQVEALYLLAIETARSQQSRLLELRAVSGLGKLRLAGGKLPEKDATPLKKLVEWFPEGLDLPDIVDARNLHFQIT